MVSPGSEEEMSLIFTFPEAAKQSDAIQSVHSLQRSINPSSVETREVS